MPRSRRNIGYPIDPTPRVLPRPDQATVSPLPTGYVANPGGYVTLRCNSNDTFNTRAGGLLTSLVWSMPDEIVTFHDPNHVYNAIEIDAEFPRVDSNGGSWAIPDLFLIKLDYFSRSVRAPGPTSPFPFFGGRYMVDTLAYTNAYEDLAILDQVDFTSRPNKERTPAVIGDNFSYNASQILSSNAIFRIYGLRPFTHFTLVSYGEFRGKGGIIPAGPGAGFADTTNYHINTPAGALPQYTVRTWYDGRETTLRVVTV